MCVGEGMVGDLVREWVVVGGLMGMGLGRLAFWLGMQC